MKVRDRADGRVLDHEVPRMKGFHMSRSNHRSGIRSCSVSMNRTRHLDRVEHSGGGRYALQYLRRLPAPEAGAWSGCAYARRARVHP